MEQWFDRVVRYVQLMVCLLVAGVMMWRTQMYADPSQGLIPTLMSAMFAVVLVFTGLALVSKAETN